MKTKSKKKPKSKTMKDPTESLPFGMQPTKEIPVVPDPEEESNTFTAMETGQVDAEPVPGIRNPLGVQGGLGPLNEEGEGDRQNDQLAELDKIEPDLEPKEEK